MISKKKAINNNFHDYYASKEVRELVQDAISFDRKRQREKKEKNKKDKPDKLNN